MRMFTAVPMHAAFAVVMGYYVGLSKFYSGSKRTEKSVKDYSMPFFFMDHMILSFFQDDMPFLTLLLVFPMMLWAFFLCLKAIRKHL